MNRSSDSNYDFVEPDASSMIESMRAYGYSLPAAIADLIDNSISAGARNVWIDSSWAGPSTWISITDDGKGMSDEELRDAMRLGSTSPLEERQHRDLGRFGLGMKTASLSQCRRLTVLSKTVGHPLAVRRWDLDHLTRPGVRGWQLLKTLHSDSIADLQRLLSQRSGTTVLWEDLDRLVHPLVSDPERARGFFLQSIDGIEQHLSMVFHRYLARSQSRIRILVNGRDVAAWDPFLEGHPATTSTPVERIALRGHETPIEVKGYVLPHKDQLSDDAHRAAAGIAGWNAQQGFYLYRNERLIVAGGWLGLGGNRGWTHEEHYKLARIRVDIPNSMDYLWQLDVKKSHANPPAVVRERLTGLAQTVRQNAREVFAHRGTYGRRAKVADIQRPWRVGARSGRTVYRIDRDHPLIHTLNSELPQQDRDAFEAVLRILEETVPIQQIWLDMAERPQSASSPFVGIDARERRRIVETAYSCLRRNRVLTHEEAVTALVGREEFADSETSAILASMEGLAH